MDYNTPSSGKRERFGAASERFSVDLACYVFCSCLLAMNFFS
ncbi:MAG: hypothetical protein ACJASL_004996, partial [Paraglaciecola sp.]